MPGSRQRTPVGFSLLLAVTAALLAVDRSSAAPPPAVAILAPEIVADQPRAERQALADSLDMILSESFSGQTGFIAVDRQALDKLLAERVAKFGGIIKLDPGEVQESLRPLWSSGVLICPVVTTEKMEKGSTASPRTIISIEAVAAQTGQLLAETSFSGSAKVASWLTEPQTFRQLDAFWQEVRQKARAAIERPLVEIVASDAPGASNRFQWLADDLQDSLRAAVGPELGVGLLTPRQPLLTKEERLLRVMGLSAAGPQDGVAGLSPAPNFRLAATVTEGAREGKAFAETPFKMLLVFSAGPREIAHKELSGVVGTAEKTSSDAVRWMREQLASTAGGKTELDEKAARQQAQEELRAAEQLAALRYDWISPLEQDRVRRLLRHALRAVHLDPTCEPAAFLMVQHLGDKTRAGHDRLIVESQRYCDRFSDQALPHRLAVLKILVGAGVEAADMACGDGYAPPLWLETRNISTAAWTSPPNPEQYFYARIFTRAEAELTLRVEENNGKDRHRPIQLRLYLRDFLLFYLIPNIPDSCLDEEYAWWHESWQKKMVPPGFAVGPWEVMEAAFRARRKEPEKLRQTLQTLADHYPRNMEKTWFLGREDIVPLYLRAAGDKEWATWQPKWPAARPAPARPHVLATPAPIKPTREDFRRFNQAFYTPPLPAWDLQQSLPLPTAGKLVFAPEVLDAGKQGYLGCPYPVLPIMAADNDLLFVNPGHWGAIGDEHAPAFFAVPLAQTTGLEVELHVTAKAVVWPTWSGAGTAQGTQIWRSCWQVSDSGKVAWIGTTGHGLARFAKVDGAWRGRWLTARDGLPPGGVTGLALAEDGRAVLVAGQGPDGQSWRVTVTSDGATVRVLNQAGGSLITPLDTEVLKTTHPGQTPEARYWGVRHTVRRDEALRYNQPFWHLGELDAPSGRPCGEPLGEGPSRLLVDDSYLPWKYPLAKLCLPAAAGDCLWLGCFMETRVKNYTEYSNYGHDTGEATHLLIYRPAPFDDQNEADHDCWIGPFRGPATGDLIFGLFNDGRGRLWIMTSTGVYRVDTERVISKGLRRGISTAEWRRQYDERRGQAPLAIRIRQLVAEDKAGEALTLANARLAALGQLGADSPADQRLEWSVVQCLRAEVQAARLETKAQAVETYEQIITTDWADPVARITAVDHQSKLLIALDRWPEVEKVTDRARRLGLQ